MSQALSWVWLDDAGRTRLGLPASLGAVVIAPSRRFAVINHFRELAVVLGLALFSISFRLPPYCNVAAAVASFVIPSSLILWRIASRLK